jgi:CHAT domain-containing protein
LTASAELALGDGPAGYASLHRALTTLRQSRQSVPSHNALYVLAGAAEAEELLRTAVRIADEDVTVSTEIGKPIYIVEARLARARLLTAAGRNAEATAELQNARQVLDSLEPRSARAWFRAHLQQVQGTALLQRNPAAAVTALDSAGSFFEDLRNTLRLLPVVIARAQARLALGDVSRAMTELQYAISLLDRERLSIERATYRASLLERARDVFDQVVMLHIAAGKPDEALAYLEGGRASLRTVQVEASATKLGPPRAPRGITAVDYALIGDTLLAWVVTDTSATFRRTVIDRKQLVRTIDRLHASLALRLAEDVTGPDLAHLYDRLVRPLRSSLGPSPKPLLIVADGEIARVPFAALLDTARAQYLIEAHPVHFEPSLADARATGRHRATRALVVGDPAFDARSLAGATRLSGAAAEVDAVAREYPDATILMGQAADRKALEAAFPDAELIHYAGHAIFNDTRPEQSFLLLASAGGTHRGGRLTASDIEKMDLAGVVLVVLSACETQRPRPGRSGGFVGLTSAFRAAGARGVIGSTWKVDDRRTQALMVEFHRAYKSLETAPAALRQAQIQLLKSGDPALRSPAAWAAFRYTGT